MLSTLVSFADVVEQDVMDLGRGVLEDELETLGCQWNLVCVIVRGATESTLTEFNIVGKLEKWSVCALKVLLFVLTGSLDGYIE